MDSQRLQKEKPDFYKNTSTKKNDENCNDSAKNVEYQ